MVRKIFLALLTTFLTIQISQAQEKEEIDSLYKALENTKDTTQKIELMIQIGDYYEKSQPDIAESYYQQGYDLSVKKGDSSLIATSAYYLGYFFCQTRNNYSKGKRYLDESFNLVSKIYPPNSIEYITTKYSLNYYYSLNGEYLEAEKIISEAKDKIAEYYGKDHKLYWIYLSDIAFMAQNYGNYGKAEKCYLESIEHFRTKGDTLSIEYARFLGNISALYRAMGNFEKARIYGEKALQLKIKIEGEEAPTTLTSYHNLAVLYKDFQNYKKAHEYYLKALELRKKIFGPKSRQYINSLGNLGVFYMSFGEYDLAKPILIEVLQLVIETGLSDLDEEAMACSNLGMLYLRTDSFKQAEPLLIRALYLDSVNYGNSHYYYLSSLHTLACLYYLAENHKKASELFDLYLKSTLSYLQTLLPYLSEKEKKMFLGVLESGKALLFNYLKERYNENPESAEKLLYAINAFKGMLFSSKSALHRFICNTGNDEIVKIYEKWILDKELYTKLILKNSSDKQKLDSLENTINEAEKKLYLLAGDEGINLNQSFRYQNIQKLLKPDEAIVEFFSLFEPETPKYWTVPTNVKNDKTYGSVYYYALISSAKFPIPKLIRLASEKEINSLVKPDLTSSSLPLYITNDSISNKLYQNIWLPLSDYIKDAKTIYLAPSGLLHRVAFYTLSDGKKRLIDQYELRLIGKTSDILALKNKKKKKKNKANAFAAIYGGIYYSYMKDENTDKVPNVDLTQRIEPIAENRSLHTYPWDYLPGTLTEAERITRLFMEKKKNVILKTGNNANEETFKMLSGKKAPRILHLATHGFFCTPPDSSTWKKNPNAFEASSDPLYRCGFLLAGANHIWRGDSIPEGREDGVVTAYEVSNLDWSNTELVVLSACETGLGDISASEGVYGLQRSFKAAGAETVVMSLWQVPDKETVELMNLFYQNYMDSGNKANALRLAQKTLAEKKSPFYWGAFVLSE